ncbi:MAG TPA: hypothetical protein VIE89_27505, partial [Candidatus Binatia bacterium]
VKRTERLDCRTQFVIDLLFNSGVGHDSDRDRMVGVSFSDDGALPAMRNRSRGSDPLRCPSPPKQRWEFDPAEKELAPLTVLQCGCGH